MKTVCEIDKCTGCGACISKCNKNAINIEDNYRTYNAVINADLCVDCGLCEKVCPNNSLVDKKPPLLWQQGWALDEDIRKNSSSGGFATAISIGFIKNGGVVCSCVFDKGKFVFDFAYTEDEVNKFVGSKYVKSNPEGIYHKIKKLINDGKKVLFIGLPCQSAGVQNFVGSSDLLYTVDLICHGSPSPKILEMYFKEKKINISGLESVSFRQKSNFRLYRNGKNVEPPNVYDSYTFAFLEGLCYTENCYSCQYAQTPRVSDITLGDSWGSLLPESEQKKGISLVLCQTERGTELLSMAELHLEDVDVNIAKKNNGQLIAPSKKMDKTDLFFNTIQKNNHFIKSIIRCYPMVWIRQRVKVLLTKIGIFARGGSTD